MKKEFSMVIVAKHLFDGHRFWKDGGYVCIDEGKIKQMGKGQVTEEVILKSEHVICFDKELVMPGIIDTHTFFSGWAIYHVGAEMSDISTSQDCLQRLREYEEEKGKVNVLLGHGCNLEQLDAEETTRMLNSEYPQQPVVLFTSDRSTCIMNEKAIEIYKFTPTTCYPEKYYRIMQEYLTDQEFIEPELEAYMQMLNSRGVTTVKEMGFDNFFGFTEYLKKLEESKNLNLRIFFMSQPVGEKMNLEYAKQMRNLFRGDKIRFSGFNLMTDGTVASYKADLKEPYEGKEFTCSAPVSYEEIEKDVLAADEQGFRYSLHAQGDGAVSRIADIYQKCQMENGKLVNRHVVTDMEYSDAEDIERLGKIKAGAELYFQIMSLDPGDVIRENITRTIGNERGKNYWNRRKMKDSGMILSGATDLPLMVTSIPESVYYSCGGNLQGGEVFQKENTLKISELLEAWTYGGSWNLGMEEKFGTLEVGQFADIAVFDRVFTEENMQEAKETNVVMTIMDGEIVYQI